MKRSFTIFAFIFSLSIIFISCEKEESGENKTKISSYNDDESHKNGQNCMNCHFSGGSGEGWFTAAGSVYNSSKETPYPNATIKLYTGPNGTGTLIKTIEVDGKGNFYTTENIDSSNELYTTVTTPGGNVKSMNAAISITACNSCHGNSTDNIWVE
jgi:hypothetical protein